MDKPHILNYPLQQLSEVIVVTNSDGEITFVSPNSIAVLDLSEETILAQVHIENLFKHLRNGHLTGRIDTSLASFEISIRSRVNSLRHLKVRKLTDLEQKNTTYLFADISSYKKSERLLKKTNEELELRLEEKTAELQRKDIALAEVMNQLDVERNNLVRKVDINTQKLLLPILERLIEKSSSLDSRYLTMLKQNLQNLTSSFGMRLASIQYELTPKEIELCTLIKGGFTIKEIATMQNLSERTVETHRFNIRKKLGISSTKTNLATFLAEL